MRLKKNQPTQPLDGTMQANIVYKLRKIIADIEERGHANLTRLTVLKKWFGAPRRISSFAIFIANQASRQTRKTTREAAQLFREACEILDGVNVFDPKIPRTRATRLHARLEAFQNERRELNWTSVRVIHNRNLFLVESGLRLYLWHGKSPVEGYRLAANYCEHYDPRYGSGLNGPSVNRIEEIARLTLAIETHEEAGSKSSYGKS
jgi:hypothetical protein